MGAALWTDTATDITERLAERDEHGRPLITTYLTIEQLSDAIGLSPNTIRDSMARRNLSEFDPSSAIYRPAARIGRQAATPLWEPRQRDTYLTLRAQRDEFNAEERKRKAKELPHYNLADAAEKGLATLKELAEVTGYAQNALRRLARQNPEEFPPAVGIAARVPPQQYGPPRYLHDAQAVRDWLTRYESGANRAPADPAGVEEGEPHAVAVA